MAVRPAAVQGGEVRWLGDVQRIELLPGDRLVVSVPGHMGQAQFENLKRRLEDLIPGHQVILLLDGITLGVLAEGRTDG